MHIVAIALIVLTLILGPGLWVKSVMARYSRPANRYSRSGGAIARELLDHLGLHDVGAETTEAGDHYDPLKKIVRLTRENFDGRSLTAITVAAHEVGHALQDAKGFRPLHWRTRLVRWVGPVEKVGAGMLTLGSGAVIHFLTLPTEFDASFGRALPLLDRRRILHPGDETKARRLLTAAALTYVSGSLTSLLNIARWWAILRR